MAFHPRHVTIAPLVKFHQLVVQLLLRHLTMATTETRADRPIHRHPARAFVGKPRSKQLPRKSQYRTVQRRRSVPMDPLSRHPRRITSIYGPLQPLRLKNQTARSSAQPFKFIDRWSDLGHRSNLANSRSVRNRKVRRNFRSISSIRMNKAMGMSRSRWVPLL